MLIRCQLPTGGAGDYLRHDGRRTAKTQAVIALAGVSLPPMSLPEGRTDERDVNSRPAVMYLEHMFGLLTKFREPPYFVCTSSHRRLVLGSVPQLTHPFVSRNGWVERGFPMPQPQQLPGPNADIWDWQMHGFAEASIPSMFFHPDGERGRARAQREMRAKEMCRSCPVSRSAAPTRWPSASPTASGAGCPSPSANCCSSEAFAAPPKREQTQKPPARSGEFTRSSQRSRFERLRRPCRFRRTVFGLGIG